MQYDRLKRAITQTIVNIIVCYRNNNKLKNQELSREYLYFNRPNNRYLGTRKVK